MPLLWSHGRHRGEMVTITDRGRPVAQLTPIPPSTLHSLLAAGQGRAARRDIAALSAPDESRSRANSLRCAVPSGPECGALHRYLGPRQARRRRIRDPGLAGMARRRPSSRLVRPRTYRAVADGPPGGPRPRRSGSSGPRLGHVARREHHDLDQAGLLDPTALRTLDAIHLAAALVLGDDHDAIVTDDRLAQGALANGIAVVSPA